MQDLQQAKQKIKVLYKQTEKVAVIQKIFYSVGRRIVVVVFYISCDDNNNNNV